MIARWFWREWRSPSLLIVWLALSLAVACVLALGSVSDRMEKGLSQQSREFMAGDRALQSSRPVPPGWIEEARKEGLKVGEQITFQTMTFAGDTPQLASVKAVDDIYPMYGDLQTSPPGLKPTAGTVLLASRLMALLNLKPGDSIDVGDATLKIAGEVVQEPDSGFNPFQLAPRLLMNTADVAKTNAVQPGSRVTWRYKFGGTPAQLEAYEKWLLPQLKPEHRWYGLEQDDGALGKSLERSQQFLLLSALLTLLLAIAAVAVAMGHYCRSRYDLVAILKTLGAGRAQLRKLIVGQWLMVLALSALTGGAIGLLFEKLLMVLLKPVLPAALPPASLWPWLWAIGAMTTISLLVGLRPYRLLLATQPLRVLRRDVVASVWPLKFYLPVIIAVHGGSGLSFGVIEGLRALRPEARFLELVHRLDRDTSGVLLVAKKRSALRSLHEQLREKGMQKDYLALVRGQWQSHVKVVQAPLLKNILQSGERIVRVNQEGKPSETRFKVEERYEFATLVRCSPVTGRTHQIRVHTQFAGHPIAFDDRYGDREFDKQLAGTGLSRLFLHAAALKFTHPNTGEVIRIEAPLDEQLKRCLKVLRG